MYQEFLDFMFPVVKTAGEIHLRYFRGNDLSVTTKSNVYDVVTRADKESEEYIAKVILERYRDHKILGELFMASKDGRAFVACCNGERRAIHVSEKQRLSELVLGTGFPYDKDVNPDNNSDNLSRILPHIRGIRRMGAAAYDLCCVASGLLNGY